MRFDDPGQLILTVARGLGDLASQFVLVGGATTNLFITDWAAPAVRPTLDVDVVVEVATLIEYLRLEHELERRGFRADESPRCRRIYDGVRIDVMPTDATIIGFSNRWYPDVFATAGTLHLQPDLTIGIVTPTLFIATKF